VFDLDALLALRTARAGSTKVLGIDGHGGSGKSTLAARLSRRFGAGIVHTDDFASWDNPKNWWPQLIELVFEPLGSGARRLNYPRSQWWPGHEPDPVVDQPVTDVLILEGVGSLRREFRRFLSVALFVRAPREVCINRGITRDAALASRGELVERWNRWFDDELDYMARDEPEAYADFVMDGTVPFEDQLTSEQPRRLSPRDSPAASRFS
jgi:uridine kinase